MMIIVSTNSYKVSYKFVLTLLFSLGKNLNQESNFRQFGALVKKNIFIFLFTQVALCFKRMPNSKIFVKGIFQNIPLPKEVTWRCSVKNVSSKFSPNSQEYTNAEVSFLIKLQAGDLQIHLKIDSVAVLFL